MGAETKIEWCDHTFNPWFTGTWTFGNKPSIPEGQARDFIVVTETQSGKRHSFQLCYMNRHVMPLSDDAHEPPKCCEPVTDSDEDYYWTGWFYESCEMCEVMWQYTDDGKIIAFTDLPTLPVNTKALPVGGAHNTLIL